ncbi:hypothetical protein AM356_12650 [Proteus mirabilis]|nr:hypothetical protein AM356_12650 [Proteus mirabilis]
MSCLTVPITCYAFYHDFFARVKTKKASVHHKLESVYDGQRLSLLVGYGLQTKMHYNKIVIMITFLGISYFEITLF